MSEDVRTKNFVRAKRWRRRAVWTISILMLVGFILRGVLPLALPAVMRKVAGIYGLTCTYDRLELNLFSGDAGLWGLEFKPKEGGPPILATDYCGGNVSVLNLFKGKLNVWRVEADGVDISIDRTRDGRIPLLDRFIAATATTQPTAAPVNSASPVNTKPVDLSSPLRIDALRLSHIRVRMHDKGVTPEIDSEFAMDLRLSDLGSISAPAKFEMNLSVDPFLDTMRVTGEGRGGGRKLDAKLHVSARGIRLKTAAAYLAPFGIKPIAEGLMLTADGEVHTDAAPNNAEGFTGSILFDHLSARADQQEAAALDHLAIDTGVIDTKSIRINEFLLTGARATAGRAADGNLTAIGIEYDPTLIKSLPVASPITPQPASPLLQTIMAERWSVGEIALRDARLRLHDQDIQPAVDLAFVVDELSAKAIDHDPKNLNTAVTLGGLLHAPGLVRDIRLVGSATPFADEKKFTATIDVSGIKPDAVKPYLDQIGIESNLIDAQFNASLNGSITINDAITANLNVTQCDFHDDKPLLALQSIAISNAMLKPKTGEITVADVELAGPRISVVRDAHGQFAALGLSTRSAVATAPPAQVPATKPAATQPAFTLAFLPRVNVSRFGWKDIALDLEDRTVSPVVKVEISDIGVEATDLSTAIDSKTAGHFKAWFASPQVAKRMQVDGNLTHRSDSLELETTVQGSGLNTTPLAPFLKSFGVEPVLVDGSLKLHTLVRIEEKANTVSASLSIDHLQFNQGAGELASIDDLKLDGLSFRDGVLGIDEIAIDRPRASARRDADGTLVAGGLRLLPITPAVPGSVVPTAEPATKPATQAGPPIVIALRKLSIVDSNIDWSDRVVHPNVNTSAGASVELRDVIVGRDAEPATMKIIAHAKGSADKLTITGKFAVGLTNQSANLDVSATGLRLGPLAPYLPPGIGSSLTDGRLHTTIDAAISPNTAGGISAQLIVGPLVFKDGSDGPPLLELDSARVIVPRIDLPNTALKVDEISVAGFQTHAEKLPNGEVACAGLLIGEKNSVPPTTAPIAMAIAPVLPTTVPSAKDLLAAAHKALPQITVEKLDVNASKITLTDLSRPASSPLVMSDLSLQNTNRIDWLGEDAWGKPASKFQLTFAMMPLVNHVQVDAAISPFARQPSVQIDFAASGVHGSGLTKLVPELNDQLDGTAMDNGTLNAHFEAEMKLDRRSPIDFDVSHGFDVSFDLTKVSNRASPDGPILAGVEEVRSDGIRVVPAQSFVHVKTLEITKPIGLLTQDAKGIHAVGWIYKLPTTQPVAVAEPTTNQAKQTVETAVVPLKPAGEVRIDKLLISGLDFRVEDSAVDPPLVIPLNGLDVEVRNISSLAPYEDDPIRFSAILNADKVKLPRKGSNPVVMEERDLFSQMTANGEISLYPKLHGWAKTSVSGLDLAALEGPARQFGETLTGGLYDSSVDVRFDPTGAVAVASKFTLTDLALTEPPDGLIRRTLKLPAPLDVAIGAVEGTDGSIALPMNVTVNPNQISYADLGLAAAGGVSQVVVTALAAAPLKAVNDVGGLIGLGGGGKTAENLTTSVDFSPGSAAFGASQSSALAPLIEKLRRDAQLTVTVRHILGAGDIQIAGVRANPSKQESETLMQQLRIRKIELLQLRSNTAGKARAQVVTLGSTAAEPVLQQMRAIDRELADVEESQDIIGELLRPGAERLADRRTRAASLQIAGDRLAAVKSALSANGIYGDRVKMVSAQYNPLTDLNGGRIAISAVSKK